MFNINLIKDMLISKYHYLKTKIHTVLLLLENYGAKFHKNSKIWHNSTIAQLQIQLIHSFIKMQV